MEIFYKVFPIVSVVLLAVLAVVGVLYWRLRNTNQGLAQELVAVAPGQRFDVAEKIRLSKKQLETTLDAIGDYICMLDTDLRIARANVSYANHVATPVREIPGRKCYNVFWNSSDVCENCPTKETLETGEAVKGRVFTKRVDSTERYFEISSYPVTGEDGNVVNVIEHIRDITAEKTMNEQLIRSEKLASIGIMTAGIAHEITNPLSGISGTAVNLLQMPEKFGLNERGQERVTMILECAARATMIMKDLLRFSQKQDMVRVVTDLSVLVPKAVNGIRMNGTSQFKKEFLFADDLPKVRCDPTKIEQVITNVATNSLLSLLERRKKAKALDKSFDPLLTVAVTSADEQVLIDVIDNGVGIPEDIESKVFDPFFTTRPPGRGTGLGLSICHRIVEEHQGRMAVSTKDGRTTVSIILPVGKDPWEQVEESSFLKKKQESKSA